MDELENITNGLQCKIYTQKLHSIYFNLNLKTYWLTVLVTLPRVGPHGVTIKELFYNFIICGCGLESALASRTETKALNIPLFSLRSHSNNRWELSSSNRPWPAGETDRKYAVTTWIPPERGLNDKQKIQLLLQRPVFRIYTRHIRFTI